MQPNGSLPEAESEVPPLSRLLVSARVPSVVSPVQATSSCCTRGIVERARRAQGLRRIGTVCRMLSDLREVSSAMTYAKSKH